MYTIFMQTQFFKGMLKSPSERVVHASWAVTPYGMLVCFQSETPTVERLIDIQVEQSELITEIDFEDLDRDNVEVLVSGILKGGYLDKPGVRGKGDAALFILVNEKLRELEKIDRYLQYS